MTAKTNADSQKLSRTDLFSMAIGQIIGVGIMTMTGIAIGFTGRSVPFAYLLAGVLTIITAFPQIFIGGTANFLGGQYSQIAVLSGQKLAGVYNYVNLCMLFGISMYTLSFADYFLSLFPGVSVKLIGLVVLTVIFGMHFVGVKQAARLQNVMSIVLALGIAAYVAFGVGAIQPNYFDAEQFMTGGVSGFLLASVYLIFASGGATFVVNYSAQAKNPTKDIPIVIIVSTSVIVVLYAVMSAIASGVLPVDQVANQPLSVSAVVFMPRAVYTFFVVGGAMFALLTTLNFSIGMMTYPALKACEDGWLPKGFAACNKRFGTPHWILLAFFLVGVVPILVGLDLTTVANSTLIITQVCKAMVILSAMRLPKKMGELWGRSRFHVSNGALNAVCVGSLVITVLSVILLLVSSSPVQIAGNLIMLGAAVVLMLLRQKHVTLNPSYTEN
ncbi:amino acid transporter [Oscillospiraceae bacterium]|nr:amino acid transporter [Oscillospiraceae bacterium]